MTPRCERPMERRELAGRPYEMFPECGRPRGHDGQCVSAQAWQRELERSRRNKQRARELAWTS